MNTALRPTSSGVLAGLVAGLLVVSVLVAPHPAGAAEPREASIGQGTIWAGMYSPEWALTDDLNAHNSWAGAKVTFAGIFHDVLESAAPNWSGNTEYLLEQAWQAESTPFSNLSINASAATIASGTKDAEITAWAQKVKGWLDLGQGRSMVIAPLQEGNGDWTPYGYSPAHYENAYRRIVDIFRGMGVDSTQVLWAFAPNGWSTPPYSMVDYYPGDDYVDVVGFSGYNFGSTLATWESVDQVLGPYVGELESLAPGKPILISQTATSPHGGDETAWLSDLFTWTANRASVVGFVYFNIDATAKGEVDWRVWNGTAGNSGWRNGMQSAAVVHQWPLTDWFGPGGIGSNATGCDFNADGWADLPVGIPGKMREAAADAGAVMVLYGSESGPSTVGEELWYQSATGVSDVSEEGDRFGSATACGDLDGDGYDDLAIGAPHERAGSLKDTGAVTILYGTETGLDPRGDDFWTLNRPGTPNVSRRGDKFGGDLVIADFDGDGFGDLAVGAHGKRVSGIAGAGSVVVFWGSASGVTGNGIVLNQAQSKVTGTAEQGEGFGAALAAADFDGDGFADLAIGTPEEAVAGNVNAGQVNVVYGYAGGLRNDRGRLWIQSSPGVPDRLERGDRFGYDLAAGDFDGDGFADLAVGVPGEGISGKPKAGAVSMFYGTATGLSSAGAEMIHQDTPGVREAVGQGDEFGKALAAGDINRDGRDDLAVGVPGEGLSGLTLAGSAHVFYGDATGLSLDLDELFSSDTPGIDGTAASGDQFGAWLAIGDYYGTGRASLAVGIPLMDLAGKTDQGAVTIIKGTSNGLSTEGSVLLSQESAGITGTGAALDHFGVL